jgi:hypothetical protein
MSAIRKKPLDADFIKGSWTLQELIERSGISREEIAKTIGIPPSTSNSLRLIEVARSLNKSVEDFRELVRKKTPVLKMPGFHPEKIRAYWTLFPVSIPETMKLIDIVRPLNKTVDAFREVAKIITSIKGEIGN